MYATKSSLEVAVEAAARVDAVLAKKGRIKPVAAASSSSVSSAITGKGASKVPGDLFSTEFEINDVPLTARNLLTKGITQEEINHFSGAFISTRGRYIHQEDRGRCVGERPLYLYIQGPNKQSLDLAIQRIDSLINEAMEQELNKLRGAGQPAQPQPQLMTMQMSLPGTEKVLVGLDHAPLSFDVRGRVLGAGGTNLQYISNETGAVVTLRGRGSGFPEPATGQESMEPLHLCVEHSKPEVLQQGRQLAFSLVETIQQEYGQPPPPAPASAPPPTVLLPQGYQAVALQQQQQQPLTVDQQQQQQQPPPPHLPHLHHHHHQLQPQPQPQPQPQHHQQGLVATSITVPIFTQQPGGGGGGGQTVVTMPPSMAVPPPPTQLLQQPPPQVQLPPPGVHIPTQQGPLVPPQQHHPGLLASAPHHHHHHHHQLMLQQPPPQVVTSQPQQQHQMQQPQQTIVVSQPQVQVSSMSQPPPTFSQQPPPPQQQLQQQQQQQVVTAAATIHQPPPPPHHHHHHQPQQQATHAIITQASYPAVQYIQANGQTLMAYPAASGLRQEQGGQIQAQLQPGQILLQPSQGHQVQLAQLMQNQTIQQHLLHQAQQSQPGTVMLLQYPHQPAPADQTAVTATMVRMPQLAQLPVTTSVPPPPQHQQQHQHHHQQQVQVQQHMQHQLAGAPPQQQHHHHIQQQQQQDSMVQHQLHQQPEPPGTEPMAGQKRRHPTSQQQQQLIYQGPPLPVPPPSQPQPQMKQAQAQPQPQMKGGPHQQQSPQPRQGVGSVQQQQQLGLQPPPSGLQQQSQLNQQQQQQQHQQQPPPNASGPQALNQPGRAEKMMAAVPPPPGVTDDHGNGGGVWQHDPSMVNNQQQQQQQNPGAGQDQARGDSTQPDLKRQRIGSSNGEQQGARVGAPVAGGGGERPTFSHYSSKPQMYNSQLPFHMHQLGMYPPPPPPPEPTGAPGGGQCPAAYYQQQQPPGPPYHPYWIPQ